MACDLARQAPECLAPSTEALKTKNDQIALCRTPSNFVGDRIAEDRLDRGIAGHLVLSDSGQLSLSFITGFPRGMFRQDTQEGDLALSRPDLRLGQERADCGHIGDDKEEDGDKKHAY